MRFSSVCLQRPSQCFILHLWVLLTFIRQETALWSFSQLQKLLKGSCSKDAWRDWDRYPSLGCCDLSLQYLQAWMFQVIGIRKVVIAERTLLSLQQFDALQQFSVLELGIDLIPIMDNCLHILLAQMVLYIGYSVYNYMYNIDVICDDIHKN